MSFEAVRNLPLLFLIFETLSCFPEIGDIYPLLYKSPYYVYTSTNFEAKPMKFNVFEAKPMKFTVFLFFFFVLLIKIDLRVKYQQIFVL